MELEGVRQGYVRELDVALVHALLGVHLVVDLLDVDRRDVVGEQHELVREDLVLVLMFQGLRRDDPQLQQARHERARASKRFANRIEVDTTPYEMRLTQMGQNPLATRQNEPWC